MAPTAQQKVDLTAPVGSLRHVGARTAAKLERLSITTIRRLLWHLPSRYEDFRQSVPIEQVNVGDTVSLQGTVAAVGTRTSFRRRRMAITTAELEDGTGRIRLVWFNQPYLEDSLPVGTELSVAGKVRLDKHGPLLSSPMYEKTAFTGSARRHTGRLIPVYPETEGMTSRFLRFLIQPLLEHGTLDDYLPDDVRQRHGLAPLAAALLTLHYPERPEDVVAARRRLAFDDMLLFQLRALRQRRLERSVAGAPLPFDQPFVKQLVQSLPWELTRDQKVALLQIVRDLERPFPMNRLLQGDVGSGKTVVALCACAQAERHGVQAAVLSPTETLAQQHYETVRSVLGTTFRHVALLTGSQTLLDGEAITKAKLKLAIARGTVPLVIGTHAVIQRDVRFRRLALVVVDEQHRFGTEQRAALTQASRSDGGAVPHLLSMTATPIPRTLALTVFGDLDISSIRSKPGGRKAVRTVLVDPDGREDMERFIREQVTAGRQVFVICPAIEGATGGAEPRKARTPKQQRLADARAQVRAVQEEHGRLSGETFPELNVAMLHGKLKPKEKRSVMQRFRDGWHDILVSTSVIEVGVDVPNVSVMVIENADWFGLAQLHQFRGRVGRGTHQSWCFLVPSREAGAAERLKVMAETNDGFELAEHDLKLRGPGEFFGTKQSGAPDLTMLALADIELVQEARAEAKRLLAKDPNLKTVPGLAKQLAYVSRLVHTE